MKKTLCFTLTLFTFVTLTFMTNSFAQDAAPEYVVRVIYFHPNDRPPQLDIDMILHTKMTKMQTFFADEMERHGFGRKTFNLETDEFGNIKVHHVVGSSNYSYYTTDSDFAAKVIREVFDIFDRKNNIYLIFAHTGPGTFAAFGSSGPSDGYAFIGTDADFHKGKFNAKSFALASHELSHAFGLLHDWRDESFVTSYGHHSIRTLSNCSAGWLDVHRYFNTDNVSNIFNDNTKVKFLESSFVNLSVGIKVRFRVNDPNGLHQVQFLISKWDKTGLHAPPGYGPSVVDCKLLEGADNVVVEFASTDLLTLEEPVVMLKFIDLHGNFSSSIFKIDVSDLIPDARPVNIPDINLQRSIRKTLGMAADTPITQLDMLEVRNLHVEFDFESDDNIKIRNLKGIEHAKHLQYLRISNGMIEDITPLTKLMNLIHLDLLSNKIHKIPELSRLTRLTTLRLGYNQIIDISPLRGLTQLRDVSLGSNWIKDISPIAGLLNLENLFIFGNDIADFSALSKLVNIRRLNLSVTSFSDLSLLSGMDCIEDLYLRWNNIRDVRLLANLDSLENLYLEGNPIKNRKPLLALLRKNPDVQIYLNWDEDPLPVTLSSFRAEYTDAGVLLKWTTESEVDNAGFYIYRSETKDGEFKVVNPTMIQGAGTTGERNDYTWTDTTAKPNTIYYYRIEDVSHAGVREQLATVRLRGLVSASGKLTTRWADLK